MNSLVTSVSDRTALWSVWARRSSCASRRRWMVSSGTQRSCAAGVASPWGGRCRARPTASSTASTKSAKPSSGNQQFKYEERIEFLTCAYYVHLSLDQSASRLMMVFVALRPCSLLLDNERWKQAEVPAEFQDLVNSIADGRITLPERKTPGTQNLQISPPQTLSCCFQRHPAASEQGQKTSKHTNISAPTTEEDHTVIWS